MKKINESIYVGELDTLLLQLQKIKELHGKHPDFRSWKREVYFVLKHLFPKNSEKILKFMKIQYFPTRKDVDPENFNDFFIDGMQKAEILLNNYRKSFKSKKMNIKNIKEDDYKDFFDFLYTNWIGVSIFIIFFFVFITVIVPRLIG